VAPAANSTADLVVSVASDTFSDTAGNQNKDGANTNNRVSLSVDTALPTVAIASDTATLRAGQTATLSFTFSEDPGTSFTAADIATEFGVLGPLSAKEALSDGRFQYTATLTPDVASTTPVTVRVGNAAFNDLQGNANADGADSNNLVALAVDTVVPTVLLQSGAAGTLKAGESTVITLVLPHSSPSRRHWDRSSWRCA
jgi:hypothetical protein